MRIGYDLRPSSRKNSRRRGIGKYTFWLASELLDATQHEFVLYHAQGQKSTPQGGKKSRRVVLPQLTRASRFNWLLDRFLLDQKLSQDRLDLFHATEITSIPRLKSCDVWAHVHDLIPFLFWEETKQQFPWDFVRALRWAWGRIGQADLIITDSDHSRKDICESGYALNSG